jgi:hypothetical protein
MIEALFERMMDGVCGVGVIIRSCDIEGEFNSWSSCGKTAAVRLKNKIPTIVGISHLRECDEIQGISLVFCVFISFHPLPS